MKKNLHRKYSKIYYDGFERASSRSMLYPLTQRISTEIHAFLHILSTPYQPPDEMATYKKVTHQTSPKQSKTANFYLIW